MSQMCRWKLLLRTSYLSFRSICARRSEFLSLPLLPDTILRLVFQVLCGFAPTFYVGSFSNNRKQYARPMLKNASDARCIFLQVISAEDRGRGRFGGDESGRCSFLGQHQICPVVDICRDKRVIYVHYCGTVFPHAN